MTREQETQHSSSFYPRHFLPKMQTNRRVNVFHKDGTCIHDKPWHQQGGSHLVDNMESHNISPAVLWPLIKVFVQFSREVQGGSVKRLVFKSPDDYAPAVKCFQSAPQQKPPSKHPIVVHVAHDELFVVSILEIHDKHTATTFHNTEERTTPLTITEFCETVLEFLNRQQAEFLATLDDTETGAPATHPDALEANLHTSSTSSSPLSEATRSNTSALHHADERPPTSSPKKPTVVIDQTKLTEFTSKTQDLLNM